MNQQSTIKCHLCGNQFNIVEDDRIPNRTGVYVRCGHSDCPSGEAVFGYGKTEQAAADIAAQKYKNTKK